MKKIIFTSVLVLSMAAMAQTGAAAGTTGTATTGTGTTGTTTDKTTSTTTGTTTDKTTGTTTGSTTGTTTETTGTTTMGQTGSTTGTTTVSAGSETETTLTSDGQIAKVLLTVDEGEMDAADIAIKKAKNKDVRAFAKMMVKHHRENKKQTRDLVKMADRDATALSKSLKQDAKDANKNLKKESRDSFDMAYVQQQIDMHQKALNLLDTNLIPNAKGDNMRTHLQKTRETVSSHLTEAQNLKTKIE